MHSLVFKNTTYQVLTRLVTSGIGFLITIIIARSFGVLGYGEFTKVTAYVGLFYLIADFGINAVFLQQEEEKLENSFRKIFYLRLLISSILVILANFAAFILSFNNSGDYGFTSAVRTGVLIFSLLIIVQGVIFSCSAIFQKKLRYDLYMISSMSGALLTFLLIILSVYFLLPIEYIYASFVLGGLFSAILAFFLTGNKLLPVSVDLRFSKKILKESLPLGLMLIFNLVYFRVDILLLSFLRSTSEVGIYGLAYRFFDFLIALPLFMSNSIYPIMLKKQKNKKDFINMVKTYLLISGVLSIILIVIFWFITPLFSLIKKEFTGSILPFRILILSLPVFFATSILQWSLIAQKKQQYLLKVYFIAAIFNILLNIIFIPTFSYIASAIITGVSELVVFIFLLLYFSKNVEKF